METRNHDQINAILENLYFNKINPESFVGVNPLIKRTKNILHSSNVKNWLIGQDTYTLFKPTRRKFQRNSYVVNNINDLWQSDLVDLQKLSKHNDQIKYLLTTIDVFSKKAYVQPLKSKNSTAIIEAYKNIFANSGCKPQNLETDKGSEFIAKDVQEFFKKNNINHFTTKNPDVKAAVVERFNRTLKTRMWRYLHYMDTFRYYDVLQDLVEAYNNSYHRTIRMKPNDVNDNNILKVYQNIQKNYSNVKLKKPKLKIGDYVRLAKEKGTFEKGYETNFTEEVFKITKVICHTFPTYEIEDLNREPIDGKFYEQELQKVNFDPNAEFKIDKIVQTRGKGNIKQVLVKWKGYPDSFNSWIYEKDLKGI